MSILTLDPGDHTGWVLKAQISREDTTMEVIGGTIVEDLGTLGNWIINVSPDYLVYETFQLYAGAAKHLVHNSFYTCQIIGVIKYCAAELCTPYLIGLSPSVKKYAGAGARSNKINIRQGSEGPITEHTRDAAILMTYFEKFIMPHPQKLEKYRLPNKL